VTELARELGSLGIAAGATVCGYSLGARLALALLCAHPALFTEAVLISGSAGLADPAERARRKTADAGIVNQLRQGSLSQFVDDWQAHPTLEVAGRVASSLLEEQRAVRLAQQAAGLACSLESCGLGEMPDLRPEIGKIGARVRYVSGALDSKFSQHAAELCTLTPGAEQVTLAGVGHNPLLECPERIAALLDEPCRSLGNAHASA
jgi:2-succinyl-6-hydroxy-2,4-cyclohexadiene-1-carboxylate synthase